MVTEALISVTGLEASYGPVRVVKDLSFDVRKGESLSILGANGAGKTTLLRALAGSLVRRRGSIHLDGRSLETLRADKIVDLGISLVPEGRQLFPPLTVAENLEIGGLPLRRRNRNADASRAVEFVFELFPVLAQRRRQTAGTLSGGEQQMLAIGRALASQPRVLLLDEPSVGLAPQIIEVLFEIFHKLKRGGLTIILAEQNIRLALDLADRVMLLHLGTIALRGTPEELRGDPKVKEIYLGA